MKSKFLTLNTRDVFKALILTFITALLTGIYQLMQAGTLLTWDAIKPVIMSSITAVVGYLIKNVLTNSNGEFLTKEG